MPSAFPVQPEFGSGGMVRRPQLLEEYPDGTYRQYKQGGAGAAAIQHRSMKWSELSLAELQAILALFDSVMAVGTSSVFTFVDFLDGSNHNAIFLDDSIEWSMDGPCTYGASVNIKLVS
jgi:hypothetical protein